MPSDPATLHMLCGKIAAVKSTLAARLAATRGTVLVSEDAWLDALFPDELHSLQDYIRCSSQLRNAIGLHVAALLDASVSVVLDFAANTRGQRRWMRTIIENTEGTHRLHFLDVSDDVCLVRLRARKAAGDQPFAVTEAQFHQFSSHFEAPAGLSWRSTVHDRDHQGPPLQKAFARAPFTQGPPIILLMGMDDFLTTGCVWFPGRLVRPDHSHARACHVISEQLAGISLTADPFASRKGVRSGHRRRYMIDYRGEAARKEMPSVRLR